MGNLKLRVVGLFVLVSMLFSMTGIFATPVYATTNLNIDPGPAPADPAVCMEDVTATVTWMNKFNLIVLDHVNAPGFTHVDGGAFIGGNYNATGASDFAIQSGPTCADTSLTIVGTVAAGGPLKVLNGSATFGQATSSCIAMNSGCSATVDNTLSNATIKAELLSASSAFAAESANNSDPTIDMSGKLIFNVNTVTANGLAIFDVTATQVFKSSANNQIEFVYGGGITPATTTILINVSQSDVDWTTNASFGNSVETNAARILWNFHSATTIDFNKQWFGSMLAPLATLNANSQNLTGSIAVKNIVHAGEIHKPRIALNNTNPLKDVCENPPDETTDDSVCSDIAGGPFNQLKVDVEDEGPPYAAWEYNPIVGATTNGTATYLGGSTTAGQSYSVAPFGTITISTTNSSGTIVAYNGTQDNTRTNWTSTFGIDYVLIKAGPGSNVYAYSPEAYADYLLESPKPSISHVTFCWDGAGTVTEDPGISIKKYTNGEDADSPTGPVVSVGSTVTWTYVVENEGNVILSNVVVTDNIAGVTPVYISGDTNTDGKLDLSETWLFRTTGIATAGQYANIGTVKGDSPDGKKVSDTDPSHYFGANPGISIKKYTNGEDADTPTGPLVTVGSTVTWTYIVSNTGNVALSNVTVTDNIAGVNPVYISGDSNTDGKLDTSEIWLFRTTGVATAGQYANIGTVTGNSPDGEEPTDDDPSHYFGAQPGISIKKYTNGEDADTPTGPVVTVGSTVTWTYQVRNTGNVVLSQVVVTDNIAGVTPLYISGDVNNDQLLDLTETWLYRTTGVAIVGQYANIGSTRGTPPAGPTVHDDDPSHYLGTLPPAAALGDRVWYDDNANGVQDNGESGVPDVTVQLLHGDCATATGQSTTTNALGLYSFSNLTPGSYCVSFALNTLPADYAVTGQDTGADDQDSDANATTGTTAAVTLAAGDNNLTLDLGLVLRRLEVTAVPQCIQDAPYVQYTVTPVNFTPGANPVTVRWRDVETNAVLAELTNQPLSQTLLWPGAGVNGDGVGNQWPGWSLVEGQWVDSGSPLRPQVKIEFAINPSTVVTVSYPPANPTCSTEPTALLSALGDTVWYDVNQNGLQDGVGTPTGEPGVAGVVVNLYQAGGIFVATDTTDAEGKYLFTELQPGAYYVEFATVAGYSYTHYNVTGNSQDAADSDPLLPWIDVTLSTEGAEGELGAPLAYTLGYTNTDATLAATAVVISTTVPSGSTFDAAASHAGWVCSDVAAGSVCTLTLPTLAANTRGAARFVVVLSASGAAVPDLLDLHVALTHASLARTAPVTLAAGETNLTVDAGLVLIQSLLTTPTPTDPTNLPDSEQPKQQRAMFLPTVRSGQ